MTSLPANVPGAKSEQFGWEAARNSVLSARFSRHALRPSGSREAHLAQRVRAPRGRGGHSAAHSRAQRADSLPLSPAPGVRGSREQRPAAPLAAGAGWPGRRGRGAGDSQAPNRCRHGPHTACSFPGRARRGRPSPSRTPPCRTGPLDRSGAQCSAEDPGRPVAPRPFRPLPPLPAAPTPPLRPLPRPFRPLPPPSGRSHAPSGR